MASNTSQRYAYSLTRSRQGIIQPRDHSTIQSHGRTRNAHQVTAVVSLISQQALEAEPAATAGCDDGLGGPRIPTAAGVRCTISRRRSVSTAMWHLRPLMRLPAS